MERIKSLVDALEGELGIGTGQLLARHSYDIDANGYGPHSNVLGHPLISLPIWTADAVGPIEPQILGNICDSSLCGYLSVRAEDDYFDEKSAEAETTMMVASFFRTRHQALLAPIVSDKRFWERFEILWRDYSAAMLLEQGLHSPDSSYDREDFEAVLDRSQPLEIPAIAVLSLADRWDLARDMSTLVRHLTRATQLFYDFVDAPNDLESGNYTWVVRRLGGLNGRKQLVRGMIALGDDIVTEVAEDLDRAVDLADHIGLVDLADWAEERNKVMREALRRMYESFLRSVGDP